LPAPLNIGTEKAYQKITQFCAYQERCHSETKEKLFSFGLYKEQVEDLLTRLIEDNYINEERYAIAFAGGKFRMNDWGKLKIKYELKKKQVSEYCIRKALSAIDDDSYLEKAANLMEKKHHLLKKEKNQLVKKRNCNLI
jgi:regulatory protein